MARDWCFTSFDTTKLLNFDEDNVRYICYGRERCPTTDKEHYQGFAIFKRTCRLPKAKSWIGGGVGCHLESRRGSRDQAREYCRKSDGEFFEWGLFDAMKTTDLFKQPIDYLKEYYPEFYCRYHRGLEKIQTKKQDVKWRPVNIIVLWGESGSGKTRKVMEQDDIYKWDPPYQWFDGYDNEKTLLIDDFEKSAIPHGMLCNLLDGYPQRLNIKGGHSYAHWTKVYITSNENPDHWHDAILRRIRERGEMHKMICD
ncbi:MAG: putative viral replication protein [Circoviridae sp.]|nr:MAG: putative viral replication protein [Circoviridae sp.]